MGADDIGEEPRVGAQSPPRQAPQARHSRAKWLPRCRSRPHPRVQHLAGVWHRHQRVIAQHAGVAVRGAVLGPAAHLTHRGVQIDRHLRDVGRRAHRPRPHKPQLGRLVELALPERERPQPQSTAPSPRQHRTRRPTQTVLQRPPTSIDATKVNTLRPDPEPASRPSRTVSSISASKPSLDITGPPATTPHRPQRPIVNTALRSHLPLLTGSASSRTVVINSILPWEAFLVDAPPQKPHHAGGSRLRGEAPEVLGAVMPTARQYVARARPGDPDEVRRFMGAVAELLAERINRSPSRPSGHAALCGGRA